jgi:glycosyltransferase involved in cell wall biosynthesis
MRVCAISFKECWRDDTGRWHSSGGFPVQMAAIAGLFDAMTLVTVEGAPQQGGVPLPASVRVVPLRRPVGHDTRRKLSVMASLPHYVGTIARHVRDADVVHVPLPGDIPLLGLYVALAMRKRTLLRYGGSWTSTSQTTTMNRVTRASLRAAAGGRNVVLVTGAGTASPGPHMHWMFATAIGRDEVATVRPDLGRGLSSPARLVYVGRLSPEKGVALLVDAMARLRDGGLIGDTMPRLTLIGDGPQRAALQAMVAKRGCADVISFAGQFDRAALVDVLQRSDLCVLPSLTESFCKARLDAMMCGVPVVTTEVGFGRAIVGADGERGWVVPSGDPAALAATLRQVVQGPTDWPAIRRRCRHYTEEFTVESWAAGIGRICAAQWGEPLRATRTAAPGAIAVHT